MTRNDGGPAFPARPQERLVTGNILSGNEGMSLRDWFAGQALMGMIASRNPNFPLLDPKDDAEYVFDVADAMLKARGATE